MGTPVLPRMELVVLKNKSGSDTAQVPTAATIQVYRQGATVSEGTTIPGYTADFLVQVYDSGDLATNDTVRVGTGSRTLLVVGIVNSTEILVANPVASQTSLSTGTRLVPTTNPPQLYDDPCGQSSIGSSIATDPATGRAAFYISRNRVDYDVVIAGQAKRLLADAAGEFGRSDQRWNDVRDFGWNVQAAIDALPADGGVVFVPAGEAVVTASLLIQKPNVKILGEGLASVIKAETPDTFDLITVERPNFQLEELVVDGNFPDLPSGTKSCVVVRGPAHSGQSVAGMGMRNVIVRHAPRYGLWLRDPEGFFARGCFFTYNRSSGVRIEGAPGTTRDMHFESCGCGPNRDRGLEASDANGLLLLACVFEGNQGGAGESEGNGVEALRCDRLALRSCYFEDAATTTRAAQFLLINACPSAVVEGCWFQGGFMANAEPRRPKRAVRFIGSPGSRLAATGMEAMHEKEAVFDADSPDCVEMGIRTFAAVPSARYEIGPGRFFSMSRRSLGLPGLPIENDLPKLADVRAGALAWVTTLDPGHTLHLRIYDGATWRGVSYS